MTGFTAFRTQKPACAVLAELLEAATPRRVAWATYEADIAWKRPL